MGNTHLGWDVKANCFLKLFLASLLLRPLSVSRAAHWGSTTQTKRGMEEEGKKQREREQESEWREKTDRVDV